MGAPDDRRTEALDDGGRVQRGFRAFAIPAGTQCRELLGGLWFALWGSPWRRGCAGRSDGTAADYRYHPCSSLCALRRPRSSWSHPFRNHGRRHRPADLGGRQNGRAIIPQALGLGAPHCNRCIHRCCDHAVAAAVGVCCACANQHRVRMGEAMNDNPLIALAGYFALLSLFAVGGANAAIPEMHRISVEVMHWMTDRQFADSFAISQVSPGPNIIIVTLIGYHVAGLAGAAVATAAMCGPTCVLAFLVARTWDRFKKARWRVAIQGGLVPVSLGLIAASAFVLARSADHNIYAAGITAITAIVGFATRINPLWIFAVGGLLGLSGWL